MDVFPCLSLCREPCVSGFSQLPQVLRSSQCPPGRSTPVQQPRGRFDHDPKHDRIMGGSLANFRGGHGYSNVVINVIVNVRINAMINVMII